MSLSSLANILFTIFAIKRDLRVTELNEMYYKWWLRKRDKELAKERTALNEEEKEWQKALNEIKKV